MYFLKLKYCFISNKEFSSFIFCMCGKFPMSTPPPLVSTFKTNLSLVTRGWTKTYHCASPECNTISLGTWVHSYLFVRQWNKGGISLQRGKWLYFKWEVAGVSYFKQKVAVGSHFKGKVGGVSHVKIKEADWGISLQKKTGWGISLPKETGLLV